MKINQKMKTFLPIAAMGFLAFTSTSSHAALIARVDFGDGGAWDATPEDLNAGDGVTVSANWFDLTDDSVLPYTVMLRQDGGADSASVEGSRAGRLQTTTGIYFSITIPDTLSVDLTQLSFFANGATGGTTTRSLEVSSLGVTHFDVTNLPNRGATLLEKTVDVDLSGLGTHQNLTDTTVNFVFVTNDAGVDINGIVLEGTVGTVPEPTTTALLGLGGLALILRRRK
jgi:hypothetical protein